MRYTEKEHPIEISNPYDIIKVSIGMIIGSPLRLINEITLKVAYFDRGFNLKILFGASIIGYLYTFITTLFHITTGKFTLLIGNIPLITKLIALIALSSVTYLYYKGSGLLDTVEKEREKTPTTTVRKLEKERPLEEDKSNINTQESLESTRDAINKIIVDTKGSNIEPKKFTKDLSYESLVNLDVPDDISLFNTKDNNFINDTEFMDEIDLERELQALASTVIIPNLSEEDIELNISQISNAQDTSEQFLKTYSDNPECKINYDIYYSADVVSYKNGRYMSGKKAYKSAEKHYGIEELEAIRSEQYVLAQKETDISKFITELFNVTSITDDWWLFKESSN